MYLHSGFMGAAVDMTFEVDMFIELPGNSEAMVAPVGLSECVML